MALEVLRLAARQSEREGTERLSDAVIADVVPERKRRYVSAASRRSRTTGARSTRSSQSHEPVAPADLYEQYRDRVDHPRPNG